MKPPKTFSRFVRVLLMLVAVGAVPVHAAPPPDDPLVGEWFYYKTHRATFNADGTAVWDDGGRGTWEYLRNPQVQRHYRIIWGQGKSIDLLVLAEDHQRAHVTNQGASHAQYDARRTIPDKPAASPAATAAGATPSSTAGPEAGTVDAADPVVGHWVWKDGLPATFRANGVALKNGGKLHGTWEYLPGPGPGRNYRVTWENGKWVETFTCASDGQSAHGVNNEGAQFDARRAPDRQNKEPAPDESTAHPFGTSKP